MNGFFDIDYACLTDVGLRRSHNQDSHASRPAADLEQWQGRGHVFLVADGMGGHAVGELASKLAADGIPHIYIKHAQEGPAAALRRAFIETNLSIHNRGQANQEFAGMGTTATALIFRPEGVWVGNVGDSRAYRIRSGQIEQLSFDHSLVWELARMQKKKPEEMEGVQTNRITRSLGPEPFVLADIEGPHPLQPGDIFVLCSDGLSGPVSDRDIGAIVSTLEPGEACRFLIHLANWHGGPDNITAVVVRIKKPPPPEEQSQPNQVGGTRRRILRFLLNLLIYQWPLVCLFIGILLCIALVLQSTPGHRPISVFLMAAFFLLAGVVGLMIHSHKETQEIAPEEENRPLHIYRETSCAIDQPLVQHLAQTRATLEARLRQTNWEMDWDSYTSHVQQGQNHFDQDRFPEAYREHCRATMILLDAVALHRHREESFRPHWDKAPEGSEGTGVS